MDLKELQQEIPYNKRTGRAKKHPTVKERDNPLLNEIFSRFSLHEIARLCGISQNAVGRWKYIPTRFIDVIAKYCDIPANKIYANTDVCIIRYTQFSSKNNLIFGTLGQCQETIDSVKEALTRGNHICEMLLKHFSQEYRAAQTAGSIKCGIHQIRDDLELVKSLMNFIRDTPSVHKEFTHFMFVDLKKKMRTISSGQEEP